MEVVACEPDTVARIGKSTTIFCELLGYFYVFFFNDLKIFESTARLEDRNHSCHRFASDRCIGSRGQLQPSLRNLLPPNLMSQAQTIMCLKAEDLCKFEHFVCIPAVLDSVEEKIRFL